MNGLAGPSISPKKKSVTTSMVSSAQPTMGSSVRVRNLHVTTTRYPTRINAHNRIEPSNATHSVAMVNKTGVSIRPCSATYLTLKSCVSNADSIVPTATTHGNKDQSNVQTNRAHERRLFRHQ